MINEYEQQIAHNMYSKIIKYSDNIIKPILVISYIIIQTWFKISILNQPKKNTIRKQCLLVTG